MAYANSAQTVLYFFLLMIYEISPCKLFWLCVVLFNFFFIHLIQIWVFPFYQIASRTHLWHLDLNRCNTLSRKVKLKTIIISVLNSVEMGIYTCIFSRAVSPGYIATTTLKNGNSCCNSCGSRATHLLLRIKK